MEPQTAKIFMSGGSQAVRLPKEYRFDTEEVYITKQGSNVIISTKNPSDSFSELNFPVACCCGVGLMADSF